MGTPLGPKYLPYTYMDPVGIFIVDIVPLKLMDYGVYWDLIVICNMDYTPYSCTTIHSPTPPIQTNTERRTAPAADSRGSRPCFHTLIRVGNAWGSRSRSGSSMETRQIRIST